MASCARRRTAPAERCRFRIGAIYWRQGNAVEALRVWRQMTPDRSDSHFIISAQIVAALHGERPIVEEIDAFSRTISAGG